MYISGRLTWTRLQQQQEQRYPVLTVQAVFACVQTKVWLPILGIFNVRTDVSACDYTRGLCGHRKRVCTESCLWEKNPLPHRGIEPASAACRSDALPTELHPHPIVIVITTIVITTTTLLHYRCRRYYQRRCCQHCSQLQGRTMTKLTEMRTFKSADW